MKFILFLTLGVQLASAVSHSLQYFYTAVTPGIHFPEFTCVGMVDEEQFVYYDSNIMKMIPKTEWIQKVVVGDPGYWDRQTQILQGNKEIFKINVDILMLRFNQSGGIHTVQLMYGCQLTDDGSTYGYMQFGYDGEDFLSLDLYTLTWIAPKPQSVITKYKWDANVDFTRARKKYLENICIEWLQKYVEHGRSTLERKVPPEVDLFQKDYSSPVVCHATGFFPKEVIISWQKNGEDLHEDVELGETLVNEDGTFQKKSLLTVSSEELKRDQYSCIIYHVGLEKEKVLMVSNRRLLTDDKTDETLFNKVISLLGFFFTG
ncbi:class I histocompatibility antigen, F10 alpha chain-like [Hoplias malabaricus]|uniref:class I histocompatibility antigen, F10 alpha chain-like n=1 Tax=Hoplias malabaricus TaxID=27720 RepID=UPI003461DECD